MVPDKPVRCDGVVRQRTAETKHNPDARQSRFRGCGPIVRQFVLHRAALESLPTPLSGDEERRSRETQEFHEQRSGCVGVYRFAFRGTTSRPAVVAIPDYWVSEPGQTVKCLGGSQGQWHRGWQADLGKIGIYA